MNHPHHLSHLAHHHLSSSHPSGRVAGGGSAVGTVGSTGGPTAAVAAAAAFQHSLNHHRMMTISSQDPTSSFFPSSPRFKNLFLGLESLQDMNHHHHGRINLPPFHPHSLSPLSMPSLSPSSPSSSSPGHQHHGNSTTGGSGHGFRGMKSKICGVCGDRAKSYHFGGISCDSCKAFFRRSVQNDAYKNFHCPYEAQCDINISSRKCCQFCRFKKCLSIGMEKSWVMTEEERLQMLKARLEKRQKQESMSSSSDMASPTSSSSSVGQIEKSPLLGQAEKLPLVGQVEKSHIIGQQVDKSTIRVPFIPFQFAGHFDSNGGHDDGSDVRMIENLVNHYIISCQEIPLRFPPCEEEEEEVITDGGKRGEGLLNRVVKNDDEKEEERHGERRKRKNEEGGKEEEMGLKKKSTSSSSSSESVSSPPVVFSTSSTTSSLQESRHSVSSSSSESINIISVDDEEEEEKEQIEEGKIKKKIWNGSEERRERKEEILMNGVEMMISRCSKETNGRLEGASDHQHHYRSRSNHHHSHVVHSIQGDPHHVDDGEESDLLNSSNSCSSSTSSTSSSSWRSTINSLTSDMDSDPSRKPKQSKGKILELLFTSIQQLTAFCKKVNCFNQLPVIDQEILLKGSILEMCILRSGSCFDPVTNSWPDPSEAIKSLLSFGSNTGDNYGHLSGTSSSNPFDRLKSGQNRTFMSNTCHDGKDLNSKKVKQELMVEEKNIGRKKVSLSIFDVRPLMSAELFSKYFKFIRTIQGMNLDQISVIILCIIILMSPDRFGLSPVSIELIAKQQERYLLLLQNYMVWKFGSEKSSSIFYPKLLLKLPDLRELSELFSDYKLILGEDEVRSVQNKLQQQLIISKKDDRLKEE